MNTLATGPITIDGTLTDAEWGAIPWTDAFVDIEGDKKPYIVYSTETPASTGLTSVEEHRATGSDK